MASRRGRARQLLRTILWPPCCAAVLLLLLRPAWGTLLVRCFQQGRGLLFAADTRTGEQLGHTSSQEALGAMALSAEKASDSFAFDSLAVPSERRCKALMSIAQSLGIPERLGVDVSRVQSYIEACLMEMPENPYHNSDHVLDVVQFFFAMLRSTGLDRSLHRLQVAALFFAAVGHDLQHTGTSNAFLESQGHAYVLEAEEGVGPLESHHARRAVALLERHVLEGLPEADAQYLRQAVRETIFGTEAARHNDILKAFSDRLEDSSSTNNIADFFQDHSESNILLLQILMKAADTSNPARPLRTAKAWNSMVYEEFYAEGDEVRQAGGTPSPLCDRETNSIPKSSVGFITFHVKPTLLQLREFLLRCEGAGLEGIRHKGLDRALMQLDSNVASFTAEVEQRAGQE